MDAQTRRRERRAEKQAQWKAANPLLVGVSAKPVKPEEMFPVMEDGKYVDKWAIRTTAMIARELG